MSSFTLKEIFPIIEKIIGNLCASDGIAYRDEIALQILQHEDGRELTSRAYEQNEKGLSERIIAGNMVDWFSANFTKGDALTATARSKLDRKKVRGKWAYYPVGQEPAGVTFDPPAPEGAPETEKTGKDNEPPLVFISYSHDSDLHKRWVSRLAGNLEENGVRTIFDQWDLRPGADAIAFMETSIREANFVVVVCTEKYVDKANTRKGGAGYEKMIASAELVQDQGTEKFIPIVLHTSTPATPTYLSARIYIRFTNPAGFNESLDSLVRTILNVPRYRRPLHGSNPYGADGSGQARVRY